MQTESEATTPYSRMVYILTRLAYDIENSDIITTQAERTNSKLSGLYYCSNYIHLHPFNGNLTRRDDIDTNNLNSANTTVTNFSVTRREGVGTKPTLSILLTVESTAQKSLGYNSNIFNNDWITMTQIHTSFFKKPRAGPRSTPYLHRIS